MINTVLAKVFGTKHERDIKRMQPQVAAINDLEPSLKKLSDDELAARTVTFREQLDQGASLDDLLVPAFATVREVAMRTLGMRHYDVQLMGAMVLHRGRIAEMKTGEGKTLMSTLASYLNALSGNAVHMVTVNDYLAARDREWMSPIFDRLGIATGAIQTNMDERLRREAYAADITYGTNNEFGFDYLRDNMKLDLSSMVQRGHSFAII
ncbi:MAG: preprotein translocase subunit SecA, partial [Acidobacteriota bacterium]